MTREQARIMVLHIVSEVDYDIYKSYFSETSELEEDEIEDAIDDLINIVGEYIKIN